MADSSKTEKATPKKRRDERKKGNVFFSNDAVSVAVLLASFFVLKLTATPMVEQIYRFLQYAMGLVAGADVFYQWWDYERQLRMSKQEIKEEYKQMEGDPQVKGKIKELQRRMAQSRMMQQVPQADVVIKNPTHFAVALRYRPDVDEAPVVLAKGQDHLALRIIKMAEEHQVTVMENVPLARALYASTELNRPIPPEFYNAVAEVLVYIYRMDSSLKQGGK